MLNLAFSRRLAVVAGVVLPALETARRWRTWPGPIDTWQYWLDDYVLAALLLGAAWACRASVIAAGARRAAWLTAAWGFACGLGFMSILGQLDHALHPALGADPSGVAHGWVILIKTLLVAVGVLGLVASMRDR